MKPSELFLARSVCAGQALAQMVQGGDYKLALTDHKGLLKWSADGFKIIENSAKSNGREIGVRGRDASGGCVL